MKRRITLVVDDHRDELVGLPASVYWRGEHCAVESVEDIPEPARVQEFRVWVETKPHHNPYTSSRIQENLRHILSCERIVVIETTQ